MFIRFQMECPKRRSQLEEMVIDVKMKIKLALSNQIYLDHDVAQCRALVKEKSGNYNFIKDEEFPDQLRDCPFTLDNKI